MAEPTLYTASYCCSFPSVPVAKGSPLDSWLQIVQNDAYKAFVITITLNT